MGHHVGHRPQQREGRDAEEAGGREDLGEVGKADEDLIAKARLVGVGQGKPHAVNDRIEGQDRQRQQRRRHVEVSAACAGSTLRAVAPSQDAQQRDQAERDRADGEEVGRGVQRRSQHVRHRGGRQHGRGEVRCPVRTNGPHGQVHIASRG